MPVSSSPTPSQATLQVLERLGTHIEKKGAGRWLVLCHDNPDPDALASAAVLGLVLRRHFKVSVTLGYGGIVGRAENREMVRGLRLSFSRVRHLSWKNYSHFALVDTQPRTGNNQLPAEIVPDLVIDHHPLRKETSRSPIVDVRPDYGATASMVAEYLVATGMQPSRRVATALIYAIRSETQDFRRESQSPDRKLYDYLYPRANKRALGRIQHPKLPLNYFRTLHQALESMQGFENVIVCHLPTTPTPDDVPQVADLLLRLEGKTWCLASGPFEERLYLALRTTNPRADAGRWMRRILGRKGKGGGHGMLAGGWFPLERPDDLSSVQATLTQRFFRLLKKDPQRLAPIRLVDTSETSNLTHL